VLASASGQEASELRPAGIQSVKEKREAVPLSLDSGDNLGAPTSGSALNEASHRSVMMQGTNIGINTSVTGPCASLPYF